MRPAAQFSHGRLGWLVLAVIALALGGAGLALAHQAQDEGGPGARIPIAYHAFLPLVRAETDLWWDPRLTARGARLISAQAAPGQGYWRLVKAIWYGPEEPPFAGQHHILVDALDAAGQRMTGVAFSVYADNGTTFITKILTEAKPGEPYAANFPMYEVAPFYQMAPTTGDPADAVAGLGMGSLEHPDWKVHTSYGLTWRWTVAVTLTPTETPTASPSAAPSPSATASPTGTGTPTPTATPTAPAIRWPQLEAQQRLSGLSRPVQITHAGDGSGRLFIVEQDGQIRIAQNDSLRPAPFLDLRGRVSCCGERGLLGLAFPPGYATTGRFYVNYTNPAGDTVVARFGVSADPDIADAASEQVILTVAQPYSNHNGGHLAFGPRDGYLYIGMGDGGSAGDPQNRAQNPAELLGKLLRIDPEAGAPVTYTIPATNPFTQTAGYRPEIWASGLRNPWRFSFDRLTGDLFSGDVGQAQWEEVDFQPAADAGGANYGWRVMEGRHCYNAATCDQTGLILPVWEYGHAEGCSITGGYVYRGSEYPTMQGVYFYADYCQGVIWGLQRAGITWHTAQLFDAPFSIATFGEDETGRLYTADYGGGMLYELVAASP